MNAHGQGSIKIVLSSGWIMWRFFLGRWNNRMALQAWGVRLWWRSWDKTGILL